jgi:hypothetical protein
MKGSQKMVPIVKFHNKRVVGKSRTRWEDVVLRDIVQILAIRGRRRRAETEKN